MVCVDVIMVSVKLLGLGSDGVCRCDNGLCETVRVRV